MAGKCDTTCRFCLPPTAAPARTTTTAVAPLAESAEKSGGLQIVWGDSIRWFVIVGSTAIVACVLGVACSCILARCRCRHKAERPNEPECTTMQPDDGLQVYACPSGSTEPEDIDLTVVPVALQYPAEPQAEPQATACERWTMELEPEFELRGAPSGIPHGRASPVQPWAEEDCEEYPSGLEAVAPLGPHEPSARCVCVDEELPQWRGGEGGGVGGGWEAAARGDDDARTPRDLLSHLACGMPASAGCPSMLKL
eukprot:CAMPEP_0204133586 /NCGR_PEP_ID=MMETSP0361-20130328/15182_1 /ASSEMBLY_ACC=CAM_ASM_000343 /TAXON_ID=268821 /ORGANISM="Scrippsiella Hangoei, Strain SHTV-5" /LENGTH=253 /DNA_ID=CAMNT_0051086657 /DNA_START=253 /DNA_END=1014 /DNA_ORIENTATION=-